MKRLIFFKKFGAIGVLALLLASCSVTRNQETVGEYVDGSIVTANVKAALVDSPDTKASSIHVQTMNGDTVQLSGYVKSSFEKNRAGEITRAVEGVREVKNDLVVKP